MSSSDSGSRVSSSDRDSSGETTEKNGFSVVAAMRVTQRFSTAGSSASCCPLLNRCTSSMNSTVCLPYKESWVLASSMTARTSLTPAVTADSSVNRRPVAERHDVGERRLAGAGRSPQDQRGRGAALDQLAQRRARAEQVLLPDDLVEGARAHAYGERRRGRDTARRGEEVVLAHRRLTPRLYGAAPMRGLQRQPVQERDHPATTGVGGAPRPSPYHSASSTVTRDCSASRAPQPEQQVAYGLGRQPRSVLLGEPGQQPLVRLAGRRLQLARGSGRRALTPVDADAATAR